ncbi:MAG: AmmeMemoRadiSam system protein A [Candidatus Dadabacteria bacterium]|nr:MAG: AmmeMemoRadiSam system protein A [Candidatus Dadabacteria bacterium]
MTTRLSEHEKQLLSDVASAALIKAARENTLLRVDHREYPEALQEHRPTFVTLKKDGQLRGCIGVTAPCRPLIVDVAENAFSAAMYDTRFLPLAEDELPGLNFHISILSDSEEIKFEDQSDLLSKLRPGIDGVTIEEGNIRASFLPVMWERFSGPEELLMNLKVKAGLPPNYWSDTIRAYRYIMEDECSGTVNV